MSATALLGLGTGLKCGQFQGSIAYPPVTCVSPRTGLDDVEWVQSRTPPVSGIGDF
jgi:hypothetical protein